MRRHIIFLLNLALSMGAGEGQTISESSIPTVTAQPMRAALTNVTTTATVLHTNGTHKSFPARANTNAARGAALLAARAAAVGGDTIVVGPGLHRVTASLAKNGVNWHFVTGAIVSRVDDSEGALWDDRNTPMSFSVTGYGDFSRITTSNLVRSLVVRIRHSTSVISIQGRDFTARGSSTGKADASVLRQEGGQVLLEGRYLQATANRNGYVLWWFNGSGVVRAVRITGDYVSVGGSVTDFPTGDFHVTAEQIETAIFNGGSQPTAAMWISCQTLRDVLPDGGAISIGGTGRIYITAQKVFGTVFTSAFDGLLYLRAEKHTATITGLGGYCSFLNVDGGEIFYNVGHIDPNGFGGDSFLVTGGKLNWGPGIMTGSAITKGMELNGGTVRLNGVTINTSANGATNPIYKRGGSLIVNSGTTLVSQTLAESIYATDAQTAKIYGTAVANRAVNPNVTINSGALIVDPDVE